MAKTKGRKMRRGQTMENRVMYVGKLYYSLIMQGMS